MTRQFALSLVLIGLLSAGAPHAQTASAAGPAVDVRLSHAVTVAGTPLAPGSYRLRITNERPTLPTGEPSQNQRWVEFAKNGMVVAREIAEVFHRGERKVVGTSYAPSRAVVQLLRGGEFVRVSVAEGDARYLVYLPVAGAPIQP